MRQLFFIVLLLGTSRSSLAQLSLEQIVHNYETVHDTILPVCFLEKITGIYNFVGSPKIGIDSKGSRFFPGKIFIRDSSAVFSLIEEMAHAYQWEQKGGKFRMTIALTGLSFKALWRTVFSKKPKNSRSKRGTVWQHYTAFAYEPMRRNFWAYEFEAHHVISPDMLQYLSEPCETKK